MVVVLQVLGRISSVGGTLVGEVDLGGLSWGRGKTRIRVRIWWEVETELVS